MNNELSDIKIKGACFDEECKLNLFSSGNNKLSIIYGKNGSGKSSIAKAIEEYKKGVTKEYSVIKWFSKDSNEINFTDEEKKQIFVYNEEYIEKNIKIDSDGLKSIVMFGEQIDLDEKIQAKEDELKICKNNIEKIDLECYENDKDIRSPKYYENKIISILKEDDKWADIDAKIKNNNYKKKSSVKIEIIDDIVKSKSSDIKENIEKEFKDLMTKYKKVMENNNKIKESINNIEYKNDIEKDIIDVLEKQVEQPIVNDIEKKILDVIENGGQKSIESIKEKFEKEEIEICPYCFQRVTKEYKMDLVCSIQKVLNKDVENHKKELVDLKIEDINFIYKEFEELDRELVNKLELQIKQHNDLIGTYKKLINNKMENIFTPIQTIEIGLNDSYIEINNMLSRLENVRIDFNKNIDESDKIKKRLLLLNKQLAWYDIKNNYESYTKQKSEMQKDLLENKNLLNKETLIKKTIISLNATKSNVKIALDKINLNLEYIFFTKDRLKLELKGDRYCIYSRGNDIQLKNLSIGERNIISLCYFFSQILDNCEEGKEFKNDCFIVLDDPISSFDFENKIGIYSFLRTMFNKVFSNNPNSRVIVFSHELEVVFNMQKIASDIGYEKKCPIRKLEQRNIEILKNNKNDYGLLLEQVYKFASEQSDYEQLELTIGNVMRRVLEAFSTFTYKTGIAEISCDENILNKIDSKEQKNYFENLMYRLVLNGESHSEERALALTETSFYEYIGIEEKVKTAKDILVFLYLLNPEHIKAYLKNSYNAIVNIETWSKTLY